MTSKVHIEIQRVQTWLFAVPRLRAMVGANALLGETLRIDLPALARQTGKGWTLAPCHDHARYPAADESDPLGEHDDPRADAGAGIISRDGGHFEAQFSAGADQFADAAEQCLRARLPGLRFRVSVADVPRSRSAAHLSTELPVLAPCEWTGRGLASAIIHQGDEPSAVALSVEQRHAAASKTPQDLAGLLRQCTLLRTKQVAPDLAALADPGYLAVIHADGNGVGGGAGNTEHERAAFFHRNRVLLRRALRAAIDDIIGTYYPDKGMEPLIPLMLGGDDLLVVCQDKIALHFVVELCKRLEAIQPGSDTFKLTLGVGVVIARPTIPFHRLHDVAEQLAASAKRRVRGLPSDKRASVVDWMVYSTAWVDDPETVRRRDWLRGTANDMRVLSQRPVNVLGGGFDTLQGLVEGADRLSATPRSQLRYLVDQLPLGRELSNLAFCELSAETRDKLVEYLNFGSLWTRIEGGPWITALLDLVEVAEIARLGRRTSAATGEAGNG